MRPHAVTGLILFMDWHHRDSFEDFAAARSSRQTTRILFSKDSAAVSQSDTGSECRWRRAAVEKWSNQF